MNPDLWWYQASALKVTDGDTVVFLVDLGLKIRAEISVRIAGVDTAELFTGSDRARGAEAREFTLRWLTERTRDQRWPFLLRTHRDSKTFDRYVADVYDANSGDSLADAIRAAGFDGT